MTVALGIIGITAVVIACGIVIGRWAVNGFDRPSMVTPHIRFVGATALALMLLILSYSGDTGFTVAMVGTAVVLLAVLSLRHSTY